MQTRTCSMWDLVPRPGIGPRPPLHWEQGILAREVPRIGALTKPDWNLEAKEAALLFWVGQGTEARSYQGSEKLPLMLVQTLGGALLQGMLFPQLLEKALLPRQPHLGQGGDGTAAESQPPES